MYLRTVLQIDTYCKIKWGRSLNRVEFYKLIKKLVKLIEKVLKSKRLGCRETALKGVRRYKSIKKLV
jgi:hypothetical protein